MQQIRKAVFPVAGFGARFFPSIKAMLKELLPFVRKPLTYYTAEAPISEIIDALLVLTGQNKRAIENHSDYNQELEMAFRAKGTNQQVHMIENILPQGVECIFVRQTEQLGLGLVVSSAESAVGDEPFPELLADDFHAMQYN